ncbi:hypothetical protein GMA11_06245 [Granulicatella sp. zg-ZJ]|uniref:hypothetical protein n=1 Tax=Granulicatella sp. zg-ZJ TaxID=2678504 RepID=UPI0013D2912A|nr:hypothetical protein [Granulicatella sp. zg-ZJ]MBS4749578.1 hypothetical protein [Carnobacteriaceae bacterium zg-ZUI78]NEW62446.1 hypothetical protein [Granulicatella sp. zg-ZJ]NEW62992.1 hypothetical protein [Granulicatella sp. zg-ZJ]
MLNREELRLRVLNKIEQRGINKRCLSKILGWCPQTLEKFSLSEHYLSDKKLLDLCEYLHIPLYEKTKPMLHQEYIVKVDTKFYAGKRKHTEYSFGYKEWYTHVFHSRRYKAKIYNNFLSAEAVAKQFHGTVIAL